MKLMKELKFLMQFIKWIAACMATSSFQISLNESIREAFDGGKGLRQGDLLSSLLLVITVEYLIRVVKHRTTKKELKYHPLCSEKSDDLILLCKADKQSMENIMVAFQMFSETARPEANLQKSHIIMGVIDEVTKHYFLRAQACRRLISP